MNERFRYFLFKQRTEILWGNWDVFKSDDFDSWWDWEKLLLKFLEWSDFNGEFLWGLFCHDGGAS